MIQDFSAQDAIDAIAEISQSLSGLIREALKRGENTDQLLRHIQNLDSIETFIRGQEKAIYRAGDLLKNSIEAIESAKATFEFFDPKRIADRIIGAVKKGEQI